MTPTGVALQLARVVVLVVLLVNVRDPMIAEANAAGQVDLAGALGPWEAMLGLAAVFLLVVAGARSRDTSRVLLGMETLLAATIALVPPLAWVELLGDDWLSFFAPHVANTYIHVLALAWAAVAAHRLAMALRQPHEQDTASSPRVVV